MATIPSIPKVSSIKSSKLITIPTKINVKSGKGVPGGFSGSSTKKLQEKTAKLSTAVNKANSQLGKISGLSKIPSVSSVPKIPVIPKI